MAVLGVFAVPGGLAVLGEKAYKRKKGKKENLRSRELRRIIRLTKCHKIIYLDIS